MTTNNGGWSFFENTLKPEEEEIIVSESVKAISSGMSFRQMLDMDWLMPRAKGAIQEVVQQRRQDVSQTVMVKLADVVAGRVNGLGVLLPILKRDDISEITCNPDGSIWVMRKGQRDPERVMENQSRDNMMRAVDSLLGAVHRSANEAVPSVDAKLPRVDSIAGLKGGARVKVLHPCVAPSKAECPSINIRLYEAVPVKLEKLIAWNHAPEKVLRKLRDFVTQEARMLVCGGTASGKTTFLSAMCGGIPQTARVVKIEDPEEIWMDHPHVVTIEARPAPFGSTSVKSYTLTDGVNDAMRMSPRWLIVGEVRTGDAAAALFRAQMSDHPGLSTFHSEDPESASGRMAHIMWEDAKIPAAVAKESFSMAIDVLVQVGWYEGRRQLIGVWEVGKKLKAGEVQFTPLYVSGDDDLKPMTRRQNHA